MCSRYCCVYVSCFFFFKQKTAYEMRISDWSSDVCSSDLCKQPPSIRQTANRDLDEAVDRDVGKRRVGQLDHVVNGVVSIVVHRYEIGRASCRERVCQYV